MFQGKLCFPPLPSTVFYRTISSFIPWIQSSATGSGCHRLLCAHPSACTYCFRDTDALSHRCSAVSGTEGLVLFSSSWILKFLLQSDLYRENYALNYVIWQSLENHVKHIISTSASHLEWLEIILPFAHNTQKPLNLSITSSTWILEVFCKITAELLDLSHYLTSEPLQWRPRPNCTFIM